MTAALDTTLELETPEHIAFRYQLAGPARRGAAYVVDLLVRGGILLVFALILMVTAGASSPDLAGLETGALLLVFFALEWGYFVVFDVLANGASPGKKAFRLRVVHQSGRPITLGDSVLRNLLRAADLLPLFYAVGLVSMLLDPRFRRLGDFVAQTVVVYEPTSKLADAKKNSERTDIEGLPARPALSVEERNTIALYYRRLPYLSEARAFELAEIVAPLFIERYGLHSADPMQLLIALHERSAGK